MKTRILNIVSFIILVFIAVGCSYSDSASQSKNASFFEKTADPVKSEEVYKPCAIAFSSFDYKTDITSKSTAMKNECEYSDVQIQKLITKQKLDSVTDHLSKDDLDVFFALNQKHVTKVDMVISAVALKKKVTVEDLTSELKSVFNIDCEKLCSISYVN